MPDVSVNLFAIGEEQIAASFARLSQAGQTLERRLSQSSRRHARAVIDVNAAYTRTARLITQNAANTTQAAERLAREEERRQFRIGRATITRDRAIADARQEYARNEEIRQRRVGQTIENVQQRAFRRVRREITLTATLNAKAEERTRRELARTAARRERIFQRTQRELNQIDVDRRRSNERQRRDTERLAALRAKSEREQRRDAARTAAAKARADERAIRSARREASIRERNAARLSRELARAAVITGGGGGLGGGGPGGGPGGGGIAGPGRGTSAAITRLERGLVRIHRTLGLVSRRFRTVFSVTAALQVLRVIGEIERGLAAIVREGFRFNLFLEQNSIALAAVLGSTRQLEIANGMVVQAILFYPIILAEARRLQQEIVLLSVETIGTAEDLTGVYQRILAFTSTQKATDEERLQLSSNLLNIARLIGLNETQTLIEIRQITTLEHLRGQAVLQVLGLNIQQLRNWKEQGELVQRLNEALEPIQEIAREIGNSFQGVLESVRSLIAINLGTIFQDSYRGIGDILRGARDTLEEITRRGPVIAILGLDTPELERFGGVLVRLLLNVGRYLAEVVNNLIEFTVKNPVFLAGIVTLFTVTEHLLSGVARAFARVVEFFGYLSSAPFTQTISSIFGNDPATRAQAQGVNPQRGFQQLASAGAAAAAGGGGGGFSNPQTLAATTQTNQTTNFLRSESQTFAENIEGLARALQRGAGATTNFNRRFDNFLREQDEDFLVAADTSLMSFSDRIVEIFTNITNYIRDLDRELALTPEQRQALHQRQQEFVPSLVDPGVGIGVFLRELTLSFTENLIPLLTGAAAGFAFGNIPGAAIGITAATGAFVGPVLDERLRRQADLRASREQLSELGSEAGIARLEASLNARIEQLGELLGTDFSQITIEGLGEFNQDVAQVRREFAPFRRATQRLIQADPSFVAGGAETQTRLQERLAAFDTFFKDFVALFSTTSRALIELTQRQLRALNTLQREIARIQFRETREDVIRGEAAPNEFLAQRQAQIESLRQRDLLRVGEIEGGRAAVAQVTALRQQAIPRELANVLQQRTEFAIGQQQFQGQVDVGRLQRETQERTRQQQIVSQTFDIQRQALEQEAGFLQERDSGLQRQLEIIMEIGVLQQIQGAARIADLQSQVALTERQLDLAERELLAFGAQLNQSRADLVAAGPTPLELQLFDQQQITTVEELRTRISELRGEIDSTNASIEQTGAEMQRAGRQTEESIRRITTVTVNLGAVTRNSIREFLVGVSRGTANVGDFFENLSSSISANVTGGLADALTAKLDFDIEFERNILNLGGLFGGFGQRVIDVFDGVFDTIRQGFAAISGQTIQAPTIVGQTAFIGPPIPLPGQAGGPAGPPAPGTPGTPAANVPPVTGPSTQQQQARQQLGRDLTRAGVEIGGLLLRDPIRDFATSSGGGSGSARTGANIGGFVGSTGGRIIGTAIGGPIGGAIGSLIGDFVGSFLGGLLGGLFGPGRIAQERRQIRGDLSDQLSFDPDFEELPQAPRGTDFVAGFPDREAVEFLGAIYSERNLRRNDEQGLGTVQRYANQFFNAIYNEGLTVGQQRAEIRNIAQQAGVDSPQDVLRVFREFDREVGPDEFAENVEEGLPRDAIVARRDVLAGGIQILTDFDERINAVGVANHFLADAFARLRPEATETIEAIRNGSLDVEDALLRFNIPQGALMLDEEAFIAFLERAAEGLDALIEQVDRFRLSLQNLQTARSDLNLNFAQTLRGFDFNTDADLIELFRGRQELFSAQEAAARANLPDLDQLDFEDDTAVDRATGMLDNILNLLESRGRAILEVFQLQLAVIDSQIEELQNTVVLFGEVALNAQNAIDALVASISTVPQQEATLQRQIADREEQLLDPDLTPVERANALNDIIGLTGQQAAIYQQERPDEARNFVQNVAIPRLEGIQDASAVEIMTADAALAVLQEERDVLRDGFLVEIRDINAAQNLILVDIESLIDRRLRNVEEALGFIESDPLLQGGEDVNRDPDAPSRPDTPVIGGQTGLFATVRQPTVVRAGEGGFAEDVLIRPHRQGGLAEGGGLTINITNQFIIGGAGTEGSVDPREIADAATERMIEVLNEQLRFGEARLIVREDVLDESV